MAQEALNSSASVYADLQRERLRHPDLKWEALASRVGVKYQSLQAFEGGKAHPTLATLRRWVKALDLPPELVARWREARAVEQIDAILAEQDVDSDGRAAVRVLVGGVLRRPPGERHQREKAAASGS